MTVSGISVDTAQKSLAAAKDSTKNTIAGAYSTIDDAIHKKADEVFSNADTNRPIFSVLTSNSQAVLTAQNNRLLIQKVLARESAAAVIADDTPSLIGELQAVASETETVRVFLLSVITALNSAISTNTISDAAIAAYRADASAALFNLNSLKATLTSTIENLNAKENAVSAAKENFSPGSISENTDIKSAQANLDAAQANLEKTFIRSPI